MFTLSERAALALAEATTDPTDADAQASTFEAARQVLTDDQISAVIWVAITINAFNRVSIMSKHPVRGHRRASPGGTTASGDHGTNQEANRPGATPA
jgi:hypothetical protein